MAATMMFMQPTLRVSKPVRTVPTGLAPLRAIPFVAPKLHSLSTSARRAQRLVVKAAAEPEEPKPKEAELDFEAKLAALKGSRRAGGGAKAAKRVAAKSGKDVALEEAFAKDVDFSKEVIFYEGKPAVGDLVVNIVLGATLLWLPLTFAAVGRFQWLKFKITDMRVVVESSSPLETGVTQISYNQIKEVVTIGRGVGLWGDMVITLKDGEKAEIRSLDKYKEVEAYINEKIAAIEKNKYADPKGF